MNIINRKSIYSYKLWKNIVIEFADKHKSRKDKIIQYEEIIESGIWKRYAKEILNGKYQFQLPHKAVINKIKTGKKKTIYLYPKPDDLVLKVINRLLITGIQFYISPLCHSFQKNKGAKTAFKSILNDKNIHNKSCIKLDIKNFFNSIDGFDFMSSIPDSFKKDKVFIFVLENTILNPYSIDIDNKITKTPKGLMAGTPLAPTLTNIYLKALDDYFYQRKINYIRYSDDIILFDYPKYIENHYNYIVNYLTDKGLEINTSKTAVLPPNTPFVFLGFHYCKGSIDISEVSLKKMKGKIRRLAKSQRRKIVRGKLTVKEAIEKMLIRLNRKLYGIDTENNELCWAQWYFPIITTSVSLKILDKYIQQKIRYVATGKYSKLNYKTMPYNKIKEFGYISLVNSYYNFKNHKYSEILNKQS